MNELDAVRLIVAELHAGLDRHPYHVFLGVDEQADGDELRRGFHARAQLLHPDRFHELDDTELRARIYSVYKRVTEAYRVLGDPTARRQYDTQRQQGKVRLDKLDRAQTGPRRPEDAVGNPQAKKYLLLALDAERRGDQKGAKLNLKMALQMEPDNPYLLDKLEKLP